MGGVEMESIIGLLIAIPIAYVVGHFFSHWLWGRWFEQEKRKIEEGWRTKV